MLEGLVAAAEQSLQEADAAYTTEQSDVDSLEKRRLPLIGAAAKDRHEVALWTERGERDVAADVATRARATLAATEAQLHRVRLELDSLGDTETPFDMAVRAYAADAVGPHASDLRNANGEIAQTRRELARLDEALVGGYAALDVLDEADTLLRSAQFWGPAVGLLELFETRHQLDYTTDLLSEAGRWLQRFRAQTTQWLDVAIPLGPASGELSSLTIWVDQILGHRLQRRTDEALARVADVVAGPEKAISEPEGVKDGLHTELAQRLEIRDQVLDRVEVGQRRRGRA